MSIVGGDIVSIITGGVLETIDGSGVAGGSETKLDKKLLPAVEKVIDKLGKNLLYRTYPNAESDNVSGEVIPGVPVDHYIKSLPPSEVNVKLADGDVIKVGDMVTGFAARNAVFVPEPDITVVIVDNVQWTIVKVSPVYSGERVCMYSIQLRRA